MMSAEAAYGYAGILNLPYLGPGAAPTVANRMYDRIADTDFRKLSWVAPSARRSQARPSSPRRPM